MGKPSKYGENPSIFSHFYGFSSKWRLKRLLFPVLTSDLYFSSSTLLATIYISIAYVGNFSISRGSKFENSKIIQMSYKNFPLAIFLTLCDNCGLLSSVQNVGTSVLPRLFLATFSIVVLTTNFEADFRHFANRPDIGANISENRLARFSVLIRPSG